MVTKCISINRSRHFFHIVYMNKVVLSLKGQEMSMNVNKN